MSKKIVIIFTVVFILSFFSGCIDDLGGNQKPTASFTAFPSEGYVPFAVDFTSTANDPDGKIVSYSWNFGDGATSTLQNPVHTYEYSGTYYVTQTVYDNNGASNTYYLYVYAYDYDDSDTSTSYSLNPTDDAHTKNNDVNSNFGSESTLLLHYDENSGGEYANQASSWLKFDLTGFSSTSTVSSAELKLYCTYCGELNAQIVVLGYTDTTWDEDTVVFANDPILSYYEEIDTYYATASGTTYSWDLTDYIEKNLGSYITLQIYMSTGSGDFNFYSKDCSSCSSSQKPTLEITLS